MTAFLSRGRASLSLSGSSRPTFWSGTFQGSNSLIQAAESSLEGSEYLVDIHAASVSRRGYKFPTPWHRQEGQISELAPLNGCIVARSWENGGVLANASFSPGDRHSK